MDELRFARRDAILEAASRRSRGERAPFVTAACEGDSSLEREILSLLRSHDRAEGFLEGPTSRSRVVAQSLAWDEPMLGAGRLLADRFQVLRRLARGGMGEVYEARDLWLNERVAIKTVRPELSMDRGGMERMKRELRISRKVTHQNVCRVHDVFSEESEELGDTVFMTMEYLAGESLASRLKRVGPMGWREGLPVLDQLLAGLHAAFAAGVIHRDLKTANIMLVPLDEGCRTVIMDFGVALFSAPRGFHGSKKEIHDGPAGHFAPSWGTPAYMSPEQLRGELVNYKSDLFSFGVVAYELLTGEHPYAIAADASEDIRFECNPRRLRSFDEAIPLEIERLVLESLSVKPGRRPEPHELRWRLERLHPQREPWREPGSSPGEMRGFESKFFREAVRNARGVSRQRASVNADPDARVMKR